MSEDKTFDHLGLAPVLLRAVQEVGYTAPTPIQREAIPPILEGKDVVGTAQTGSGKTAAFLLPIMHRLLNNPRPGIRVLVLTPTRELAAQIETMLGDLGRGTGFRGKAVYGGVGMAPQEEALRKGFTFIIATPGRLLDHMGRGYVDFRGLEVLVLDEGDRMLDMGFLPDVRRIIDTLPRQRQTMLFSATMPREIEDLARDILMDPVRVEVGPHHRPPETIRHAVFPVPAHLKPSLLVELLGREDMLSVLVFTRTKRRADQVAKVVARAGFEVGRIHGDRTQGQREAALEGFRSGRHQILVATDVAARGLDILGISHVINYDVPQIATEYIHRVGRTARAEAVGEAITLVSPPEEMDLRGIETALGHELPREKAPGFDYDAPAPPRTHDRGTYRGRGPRRAGSPQRTGGGRGQGGGRSPRGGHGGGRHGGRRPSHRR